MKRPLLGVAVVLVVAVLGAPAMAEPATTEINGSSQMQPGGNVTYSFNLTNTGENSSGYVLNTTLPDGWEIVNRSDDGGAWKDSETQWAWLSVEPGTTKEPSLTLTVPASTNDSSVEINASVSDSDGVRDTASTTVTVSDEENESSNDGGSGGGSDDDDGGSSSGGSDDDDGGSSSGGSDDDDGGYSSGGRDNDDGGSTYKGSDDEEDDGSNDSGVADATGNESTNTTETVGNESTNTTETVGNESTNTTETASDDSESDPSDESATDGAPASETGPAASDGGNTGLGIGAGALLLVAVGVGMVTARRRVTPEPTDTVTSDSAESAPASTERPTDDRLSASDDAPDIDLVDVQRGDDGATLTYATTATSNKAIGDEIREVAGHYASAGDEVASQRLEATVTDGSQPVATWHIRTEWLEQFDDGTLSREDFELKVLGTMNLVS